MLVEILHRLKGYKCVTIIAVVERKLYMSNHPHPAVICGQGGKTNDKGF